MWQLKGWITDKDKIVCSRAVVKKVSWQCRNKYLLPTAHHNAIQCTNVNSHLLGSPGLATSYIVLILHLYWKSIFEKKKLSKPSTI